jgi:hypothetical protein
MLDWSACLSLLNEISRVMLGVVALAAMPVLADPVPVRFTEGVAHGFLNLSTTDGSYIASGDLTQVERAGQVRSRMVFHFKDGSLFDESVVFTQRRVFVVQTYHLLTQGNSFAEDSDILFQRASGSYVVTTTSHKDKQRETIKGTMDLPADVYNGIVITAVKNLHKGQNATVHLVAFTPKPLLVELELQPMGTERMKVGSQTKAATHYVFKPRPGPWLEFVAKLLGRMPPNDHAWIITQDAPAFARFEGPLHPSGPAWRINLANPQ